MSRSRHDVKWNIRTYDYVLTFQSQKGFDVRDEKRKGTIDPSDVMLV
jgi:hypothetical protein